MMLTLCFVEHPQHRAATATAAIIQQFFTEIPRVQFCGIVKLAELTVPEGQRVNGKISATKG
jgi:hypothetical protein